MVFRKNYPLRIIIPLLKPASLHGQARRAPSKVVRFFNFVLNINWLVWIAGSRDLESRIQYLWRRIKESEEIFRSWSSQVSGYLGVRYLERWSKQKNVECAQICTCAKRSILNKSKIRYSLSNFIKGERWRRRRMLEFEFKCDSSNSWMSLNPNWYSLLHAQIESSRFAFTPRSKANLGTRN